MRTHLACFVKGTSHEARSKILKQDSDMKLQIILKFNDCSLMTNSLHKKLNKDEYLLCRENSLDRKLFTAMISRATSWTLCLSALINPKSP